MRPATILNVNPNADLLPKTQDSFTRALDISNNIYGMVGKHYENKLKDAQARNVDLEAQKRAGTLESDINAQNTKNNTDIQYYPQIQAAELAKQGASIKEIQARTGLSYAEAGAARARAAASYAEANKTNLNSSPIAKQQAIYNQYAKAAPGSREQMYYGGLLKEEMGKYGQYSGGSPQSGGNNSPGGSSVPPSPQGGAIPNNAGGMSVNPYGGGPRSPMHQVYDQSTGQTMESPTSASATQSQNRVAAHAEIEKIYPKVINGIKPYQGPLGSFTLMKDAMKAKNGDKNAQKRLVDYETAKKFLPELASMNAKQSTGSNPGIELTREYQNAMFPSLPGDAANYLVPADVRAQANQNYLPLQGQGVESAIAQERQNFKQDGPQPAWAAQQQNEKYNDPFYDAPNQSQYSNVASGFNGNPNVQQQPSQQSQQPKIEETKSIGGDEYVKVNGKWYHK